MRPLGLTLTALVLAGPALLAQSPPSPAVKPAVGGGEPVLPAAPVLSERNQKVLDHFLAAWEKRMKGVASLDAKCAKTEVFVDDRGQEERRVTTGEAQLMKPNYARLFLKDPEDPGNTKRASFMVSDGKYFWDYQYAFKVVKVQELEKDGFGDSTLMSFLFGTSAAQLKQRYHLAVDEADPKRYNKNYVHIMVLPKTKADLQEFKKAELVLWKNTEDDKYADLWMLPARVWFQKVNGEQAVWQFENMTTKKNLTAKHFEAPQLPDKTWRREWMTLPKPDVVRPVSGAGVPKK
ncbi:MAG TPA: TIGR03009 domain-containing protein [Gemmataceae bacterium]|nr:TIGR03009 domain-containing protein [Gemmataceae bacterium]